MSGYTIEHWLIALNKCVAGELEGELWENPCLLSAITYNGFLIEVHLCVKKQSVINVCWDIIALLEDCD